MSTTKDLFHILLIVIAIILNIFATRKLIRSKKLSIKTKRLNITLTWLIPYIWALLVLSFSDKPPKKTGKFDSSRYMDTGYPGG